jgi:hypothetical protein
VDFTVVSYRIYKRNFSKEVEASGREKERGGERERETERAGEKVKAKENERKKER